MGSRVIHVKRNDTNTVEATMTQNGAAVSLTGATVKFLMWSGNTLKVNSAATVDPDQTGNKGKVSYSPAATDFDTADTYHQEWEVTFASGIVQTYPDQGYNTVVVEADLG